MSAKQRMEHPIRAPANYLRLNSVRVNKLLTFPLFCITFTSPIGLKQYSVTVITADEKQFIPPDLFKDEKEARDFYDSIAKSINSGEEKELMGVGL
jgi:hypothetical protein